MYANYFDPELPFEYRLKIQFLFIAFMASTLSLATNISLGSGFWGTIMQIIFNTLCLIVFIVPLSKRKKLCQPMLIFLGTVYVPYMFFQTAGYDGTDLFFMFPYIVLVMIAFNRHTRWIMLALCLLESLTVIAVNYLHPELIVPHANSTAKLIDLVVGLTLSIGATAFIAFMTSRAYEAERKHVASLLEDVEVSNRRNEQLSRTDFLTGALNRRAIDEHMSLIMPGRRPDNPLSIIMVDIDNFKQINDKYGHGFGDVVLRRFASAVSRVLREYELLARHGGEEFLVILDKIDLTQARAVAERIRNAVAVENFTRGVRVTASLGVAQWQAGETWEDTLRRADELLYKAKRAGKNRVVAK